MKRRDFLLASAATGMASAFATRAAEASPTDAIRRRRPNILFLWTDQQNAATLEQGDSPWLSTPNLDTLAREGMVFERAYCNDPICVPSRSNWITGQVSHQTGVTFNTEHGGVRGVPLSRALREAGYDCGYFGKWHIPHPVEDHAWHGFTSIDYDKPRGNDLDVVPGCAEFLRREREEPFFLVASFVNPHDICEWAREAAGVDKGLPNGNLPPPPPPEECPPLPANFAVPAGEPEVVRQLQAAAPRTYPTKGWDEGTWRQYLWAYYRLVNRTDAQIGAILSILRETGVYDDTLIVFSSDHGDGAGSHGWNQKTLFYEECARVPFIVRPPRGLPNRAGQRDRSNMVSLNLDFFPTVYDYAGLPAPAGLAGQSVRPLVEGRSGAKGHVYLIGQNSLSPRYEHDGGVYGRMLLTERYKYIRFSAGETTEQVFDLQDDPGELNDLTLDPAAASLVVQLREQLEDWMQEHGDPFLNLPPEARQAVPT